MAENRRSRSLLDSALSAGSLTTIATGGALIGLGRRDGEASRAFRLAGRGLLERVGAASFDAPLTAVAIGYVHHLAVATAWGVLLGALVFVPRTVLRRLLLAIGLVVGFGIASFYALPPMFRIGYAVTSDIPGVVCIVVALILALSGNVALDAVDAQE